MFGRMAGRIEDFCLERAEGEDFVVGEEVAKCILELRGEEARKYLVVRSQLSPSFKIPQIIRLYGISTFVHNRYIAYSISLTATCDSLLESQLVYLLGVSALNMIRHPCGFTP